MAAANLAALVVQNVINQWALRRAIGTAFIDRSCVRLLPGDPGGAAALWAFQALVRPRALVGVLSAAVASVVVLVASRSAIELGDTFPELRRVPVMGWLVR